MAARIVTTTPPTCPIYVINLPRDRERGESMRRRLAALGLDGHLVEAVSGKDLGAAERDAYYSQAENARRSYRALTDGEIGCYASHLKVWQAICRDRTPMALVLEDDVAPGSELPGLLHALAARPVHWDMIKLVGREHERAWRRWPVLGRWDLVRYRRVPSMTSAYLISGDGARKLAATRRPFFRPVDIDLRFWWEPGLRVYGLLPYPIALDEASQSSSIGRRGFSGGARAYLNYRWRKFADQLNYSLGCALANWRTRNDSPFGD